MDATANAGLAWPAKLTVAALLGLSGFFAVRAVMLWIAPEAVWEAPLPVRAAPAQAAQAPALDTRFDIFHRDAPTPVVVVEDAPETQLDLTFRGGRAGPDGMAVIRTPDRSERNYYVGDEVMSGVRLADVGVGFAIIERSGQRERISQRDDGTVFGQDPDSRTPGADVVEMGANGPGRAPTTLGSTNTSPLRTSSRTPSIPDRSRVVAGDLLQAVSLTMVRDGGRLVGYRVGARDGVDLSQFGLRSGDVVTAVNGQSLAEGASGERVDLAGVMAELSSRPDATLTLLRDGATLTTRIGTP